MAVVRSIVTMPWTSGITEDLTVNTFHFTTVTDPPTAGQLNTIDTQLIAFYNTSSGVAGDNLSGFLGDIVSRVANAATIKHYDLSDPEPRIPLRTTTWTVGAADAANTGPCEVALCLSFQGDPVSGVPQARRRGRVYIGPFNTSQLGGTAGRPPAALTAAVAAAGNALHDTLNTPIPGEVQWVVWSPTSGDSVFITNGWCDNEWDTIRSRGRRPTVRTTFQ